MDSHSDSYSPHNRDVRTAFNQSNDSVDVIMLDHSIPSHSRKRRREEMEEEEQQDTKESTVGVNQLNPSDSNASQLPSHFQPSQQQQQQQQHDPDKIASLLIAAESATNTVRHRAVSNNVTTSSTNGGRNQMNVAASPILPSLRDSATEFDPAAMIIFGAQEQNHHHPSQSTFDQSQSNPQTHRPTGVELMNSALHVTHHMDSHAHDREDERSDQSDDEEGRHERDDEDMPSDVPLSKRVKHSSVSAAEATLESMFDLHHHSHQHNHTTNSGLDNFLIHTSNSSFIGNLSSLAALGGAPMQQHQHISLLTNSSNNENTFTWRPSAHPPQQLQQHATSAPSSCSFATATNAVQASIAAPVNSTVTTALAVLPSAPSTDAPTPRTRTKGKRVRGSVVAAIVPSGVAAIPSFVPVQGPPQVALPTSAGPVLPAIVSQAKVGDAVAATSIDVPVTDSSAAPSRPRIPVPPLPPVLIPVSPAAALMPGIAPIQGHRQKARVCSVPGCAVVCEADKERFEHFRDKHGLFMCICCEQSFPSHSEWSIHIQSHRGGRAHACSLCGRGFQHLRDLNRHQQTHENIKPFQCDICSARFARRGALNVHMRSHSSEKSFQCDHSGCEKSFTQLSVLKAHKRTHTGEKPFQCEVCLKSYSQRTALVTHQRTHTGDKPFVCPFCSKSFTSTSNLHAHQRIHAGASSITGGGTENLQCPSCSKTFLRPTALEKHQRAVHGLAALPTDSTSQPHVVDEHEESKSGDPISSPSHSSHMQLVPPSALLQATPVPIPSTEKQLDERSRHQPDDSDHQSRQNDLFSQYEEDRAEMEEVDESDEGRGDDAQHPSSSASGDIQLPSASPVSLHSVTLSASPVKFANSNQPRFSPASMQARPLGYSFEELLEESQLQMRED